MGRLPDESDKVSDEFSDKDFRESAQGKALVGQA
jgi:hypothetical protein